VIDETRANEADGLSALGFYLPAMAISVTTGV